MRPLNIIPEDDPSKRRRRPIFPLRTLILMVAALASFGWMWWRTHELAANKPVKPVQARSLILDVDPVLIGGDR